MVVTVDPYTDKCVVKGHCPPPTPSAFEIFTPGIEFLLSTPQSPKTTSSGAGHSGHSGQTFPTTANHNKGTASLGDSPRDENL